MDENERICLVILATTLLEESNEVIRNIPQKFFSGIGTVGSKRIITRQALPDAESGWLDKSIEHNLVVVSTEKDPILLLLSA